MLLIDSPISIPTPSALEARTPTFLSFLVSLTTRSDHGPLFWWMRWEQTSAWDGEYSVKLLFPDPKRQKWQHFFPFLLLDYGHRIWDLPSCEHEEKNHRIADPDVTKPWSPTCGHFSHNLRNLPLYYCSHVSQVILILADNYIWPNFVNFG